MSYRVSIIIPTLNEGKGVESILKRLAPYRYAGHEVIVVDGGSVDDTVALATPLTDHVINSGCGRALQMNSGAASASGDILLFLHADTHLPVDSLSLIQSAVIDNQTWGRFDVRLSGRHPLFRVIEKMMNIRSSLTGIATGDQAIFVLRDQFESIGGFPEQLLMEDIELSKRLRKVSPPYCIRTPLTTSSRRWEKRGIVSTIMLMWRLRFLYWLGFDASKLAKMYR